MISHSVYVSYSRVTIHLHIIWLNYNFRFYSFFYKASLGFVAFYIFFAWYIFMCFNFLENKKSSANSSIRQKGNTIKIMVNNYIFFCFYIKDFNMWQFALFLFVFSSEGLMITLNYFVISGTGLLLKNSWKLNLIVCFLILCFVNHFQLIDAFLGLLQRVICTQIGFRIGRWQK